MKRLARIGVRGLRTRGLHTGSQRQGSLPGAATTEFQAMSSGRLYMVGLYRLDRPVWKFRVQSSTVTKHRRVEADRHPFIQHALRSRCWLWRIGFGRLPAPPSFRSATCKVPQPRLLRPIATGPEPKAETLLRLPPRYSPHSRQRTYMHGGICLYPSLNRRI